MIKRIATLFKSSRLYKSVDIQSQSIERKKDINILLGDTILEIKMHYGQDGINNWLDTSISFIRLEKNGIICFPFSGDQYFDNSIIEKGSKSIMNKWKNIIYNTKIEDIYYILDEEKFTFDDTQTAYIVLENGYILEENRMSPSGIGGADLFCKTLEEFKRGIADSKIKIYSVKTEMQKNFFD